MCFIQIKTTINKRKYISISVIFRFSESISALTISFNDQKNNGANILADKALKDEVLNAIVTESQTNAVNTAHGQLKNNRIPAVVAMPFPPLNNKKGLNMCPNNENKPPKIKRVNNNSSSIWG